MIGTSCIETCQNILESLSPDAVVLFSDETYFHQSGCVDKQNLLYQNGKNPREIDERPLHNERVTVWGVMSRLGFIGSHYSEEDSFALTVNSNRYANMIGELFEPTLQERILETFQQDVATSYAAKISMNISRQMFPGRLISRGGDILWPASSPDLISCEFV